MKKHRVLFSLCIFLLFLSLAGCASADTTSELSQEPPIEKLAAMPTINNPGMSLDVFLAESDSDPYTRIVYRVIDHKNNFICYYAGGYATKNRTLESDCVRSEDFSKLDFKWATSDRYLHGTISHREYTVHIAFNGEAANVVIDPTFQYRMDQ